ncbi:hypothetical protein GCM10010174_61310 [Kutzneria viridogrisea]|uniref:Uncharacterized protein n=1 Tax=Kutzneria viridogrisea TaxID=47990 RepID=A0ABR6BGD9_9PSEU|nr:hypothetical protein [Kutzneria viridogrisea]
MANPERAPLPDRVTLEPTPNHLRRFPPGTILGTIYQMLCQPEHPPAALTLYRDLATMADLDVRDVEFQKIIDNLEYYELSSMERIQEAAVALEMTGCLRVDMVHGGGEHWTVLEYGLPREPPADWP